MKNCLAGQEPEYTHSLTFEPEMVLTSAGHNSRTRQSNKKPNKNLSGKQVIIRLTS